MTQSETTSAAGGGERYSVLRADHKRRIQAIGAAISRRDWSAIEQAYSEIRDAFDRPDIYDPAAPAAKGGTEEQERRMSMLLAEVRSALRSDSGADKTCALMSVERELSRPASPPPPAGAAGGGLGDLGALSAGATQGEWSVWAEKIMGAHDAIVELKEQVEQTRPIGDHLYLLNAGGKCPATTGCGPCSETNAAFIVALVNAYRSGRLAEAPTPDLGAQGEPVAWDDPDPEIDRILAMSSEEIHAELVAEGHDPSELLRKQKLGLDGLLRLAADRFRWRTEAGSWRRVAERLEEEKIAVADRAIKAWSKLKPCPEEANEALCCFPSCNCSVDRLSYPAARRTGSGVSVEEIARAMARHQVRRNQFTWNPREPLSDESVQRAEEAGWKQWEGFASSVHALIAQAPRDCGETQSGPTTHTHPIACYDLSRRKLAGIEEAWDQHTALDEGDISFLIRMARQRLYEDATTSSGTSTGEGQ